MFLHKEIEYGGCTGILYVSAALKKSGHIVKLKNSDDDDLENFVKEFDPKIIAYSVTTGLHKYYLCINREIKKYHKFISIFGGPHPTYFPEVINDPDLDAICLGEGEVAFPEFVSKIENNENVTTINNIWIKQNGRIYENNVRPFVDDLDTLEFPDRNLLYEYNSEYRNNKVSFVMASRGCPFTCPYCFNASFVKLYKNCWKLRIRSVNNVIKEIKQLKKTQNVEFIQFMDSIFAGLYNIEWLKEFTEKYAIEVKLPFYCHVRANLLTPENVRLLRQAGCKSVGIGLETGNEIFRNKVLRRKMTNETIIKACNLLKNEGIRIISFNMFGLPGGTLENDFETIELNIKAKTDYMMNMIWQPYPKTELTSYAIKNGYFDGDFNHLDATYFENSAIKFNNPMEKSQIENLQKLGAFIVEIPYIKPLIKILIKLSPNIFYLTLFRIWFTINTEKITFGRNISPKSFIKLLRPIAGLGS